MRYRMSVIYGRPVIAAIRALHFSDHVTKRNGGSGDQNGTTVSATGVEQEIMEARLDCLYCSILCCAPARGNWVQHYNNLSKNNNHNLK